MRTRTGRSWRVAIIVSLLVAMIPFVPATAAPPGNQYFQRTWARTDKPVADQQVNRTWMWGPEAFTSELQESFIESPSGLRTVQYFDKSRMEISNLGEDPSSIWYVTNGLLVVEMMEGKIQIGLNAYQKANPANVNVAGDADDRLGATYRYFGALRNVAPLPIGTPIHQVVSPGSASNLYMYNERFLDYNARAAYYVPETNHMVASPFWEFMNSVGLVHEGGSTFSSELFANPFYATGFPVTEAYWAVVKVGGVATDVLIQCFERRCLTYTPSNSAGWQVEAGNVGRHYFEWRSGRSVNPPTENPPPVNVPPQVDIPPPSEGSSGSTIAYQWAMSWKHNGGSIATDRTGRIFVTGQSSELFGGDAVFVYDSGGNLLHEFDGSFIKGDSKWRDGIAITSISVTESSYGILVFLLARIRESEEYGVFVFSDDGWLYDSWSLSPPFRQKMFGGIIADHGGHVSVVGAGGIARFDLVDNTVQFFEKGFSNFSEVDVNPQLTRIYVLDPFVGVGVFSNDMALLDFWDFLRSPMAIAVDKSGLIYITDEDGVAVLSPDGEILTRFAGRGEGQGLFKGGSSLAVDNQGRVYVSDFIKGEVHRYDPVR